MENFGEICTERSDERKDENVDGVDEKTDAAGRQFHADAQRYDVFMGGHGHQQLPHSAGFLLQSNGQSFEDFMERQRHDDQEAAQRSSNARVAVDHRCVVVVQQCSRKRCSRKSRIRSSTGEAGLFRFHVQCAAVRDVVAGDCSIVGGIARGGRFAAEADGAGSDADRTVKRHVRFVVGVPVRDEVHQLLDEVDEEEAAADDDDAHR